MNENLYEMCHRIVVIQQENYTKRVYTKKQFENRVKRTQTRIAGHETYQDKLKFLLQYNKIYYSVWIGAMLKPIARLINEDGDAEVLASASYE